MSAGRKFASLAAALLAATGALAQNQPAPSVEARSAEAEIPPLAPAFAPAPDPRPAADPRRLAREAARLYSLALSAPAASQAAGFAEALALFDRIAAEHPDSDVAAAVASGRVGMIDVAALRALVRPVAPTPDAPRPDFEAASLAAGAAARICAAADPHCLSALGEAGRTWLDQLGETEARALFADPDSLATDAIRLDAFDGLVAGGDAPSLAALVARGGAAMGWSENDRRAGPLAARLVALMAVAALGAMPPMADDDAGESFGAHAEAARLRAVSTYALALLGRGLSAAGPETGVTPEAAAALLARGTTLEAALYESLAQGATLDALAGATASRALTGAEARFLRDMLALNAATLSDLARAGALIPPRERMDALDGWFDASARALSSWRTAANGGPAELP